MTKEEAVKEKKKFRVEVKLRLERILRLITSVNGNGKVPRVGSARLRMAGNSKHSLQK